MLRLSNTVKNECAVPTPFVVSSLCECDTCCSPSTPGCHTSTLGCHLSTLGVTVAPMVLHWHHLGVTTAPKVGVIFTYM